MLFIVEEKYTLFNVIYFLTLCIMINNVKKYYYVHFIHDSTIQDCELLNYFTVFHLSLKQFDSYAYSCATWIRNVTYVQRLTVHISYMTPGYSDINIRFCWPTNVI